MSATILAATSPSSAFSVAELLAGVGRGDQSAWAEVVRRYGRLVHARACCFRMQEADVLDAVQMTWLRLAESCRTIQHPQRLGGWLATTVSRECLRILNRTGQVVHAVAEDHADPAPGPDQRAVDAETALMVRRVVAELPPRRRDLLVALFEDDPSSYAELSASMGMAIGSIGPTRARILRQLRGRLAERGLAPCA